MWMTYDGGALLVGFGSVIDDVEVVTAVVDVAPWPKDGPAGELISMATVPPVALELVVSTFFSGSFSFS